MIVAYVANHGNRGSDDTEGHIAHSLEKLGHTVRRIQQTSSPAGCDGADLLLFHHWYNVHPGFLESLKMKKAAWYFDKVWNKRDEWIRKVAPLCDKFFLSDGTFAASAGIPQLQVLRQGIGDRDVKAGTMKPDAYPGEIAFTGSVYGERAAWAKGLEKRYGSKFRVYGNVFNRDLYDLCASVPTIVAPMHPSDDHYWSNRVYLVLGSGGFLVHPRLRGLSDEFIEGVHYAAYGSQDELYDQIDYYLKYDEERRKIAAAGFALMHKKYTFTHRVKALLASLDQ